LVLEILAYGTEVDDNWDIMLCQNLRVADPRQLQDERGTQSSG
jgi:hypothetical protein